MPTCLNFLEKYLRQVCLCAFRKDVFSYIRSSLHKDYTEEALAGRVGLCWSSVNRVMKDRHRPAQLAGGNRLAVKSIEVLFAWLWEWKDGYYERKGWNKKPYRTLYQKSFDTITLTRGKHRGREWKKGLKESFFKSHWMLPYPQNQAFMRKSKETKEVVWWSSYHSGLDRYYTQLEGHGYLPQPFPTSYIEHHPPSGWGLRHGFPNYMPYEVEPEQDLLELSEAEVYQKLLQIRAKFNSGPDAAASTAKNRPVTIYDVKSIIEDPRMQSKPIKSWDVLHCSIRLNKEIEKYKILQHRKDLRRRRRKERSVDADWHSSLDIGENGVESEVTSNKESLEQQKLRQLSLIRSIERQMRTRIAREREKYTSPNLHAGVLKIHEPRLKSLD